NSAVNATLVKYPDLFTIVTLIDVDHFKSLLYDHPNPDFVRSVCRGLREGFWPWADTHAAVYPEIWDEKRPAILDPKAMRFLCDLRDTELAANHWSRSFGTSLLPGMYSMPVHAILKLHSEKMRLITDQSAGPYSLNSMIHRESFPKTVMDGMSTFGSILR
ncbi:hypothetical protein BKA93DRAFT_713930, partial [Sparassis latifolia]